MSFLDELNDEFEQMLREYPRGIGSTSTSKYKRIVELFADRLRLDPTDIYATGAMTRVSNLDSRLPQGNKKNQHTPLAVVFLGGYDRTRDPGFERLRRSAIATCSKFVNGRERGTTFDDIVVLAQEGRAVAPVVLLSVEGSPNRADLKRLLPELELETFTREASLPVSSVEVRQTPLPIRSKAASRVHADPMTAALVDDCLKDLRGAGLQVDALLIRRFLAALLVKRFVILSGLAGSGKTRLAIAVARWLAPAEEHVAVIPVGADWTTSEHLLGYPDALHADTYRKPVTGALDFLLRAAGDEANPYFLILDEMNLSHVERYFADILSAMESGEPIRLHGSAKLLEGVPGKLALPSNVFIIGTINVDETTYVFSPKVLDRANVLEFRVDGDDLVDFLVAPRRVDPRGVDGAGSAWAESFVAAAKDESLQPDETLADTVRTTIRELFDEFESANMEFGFRTAFDIWRFVGAFQTLSPDDSAVDDALDAQIVQKLLPKLHGSDRRLRPILEKLADYCIQRNFLDSSKKIKRMLERLTADGFTSFAEA